MELSFHWVDELPNRRVGYQSHEGGRTSEKEKKREVKVGIQEFIIYAQVIKRRWKPIVGLFLGTMVTLIIISILAPRVYVASARLQVIALFI